MLNYDETHRCIMRKVVIVRNAGAFTLVFLLSSPHR
jgi:hypothetical protein